MGIRHRSALKTATREKVITATTLSEEDGRVTIFTDERFEDYHVTMNDERRIGDWPTECECTYGR